MTKIRVFSIVIVLAVIGYGMGLPQQSPAVLSLQEIDDKNIADEGQAANWLAYGRTHNERRFSPLAQVTHENVAELKVDWYLDLPEDASLVSTPLVVDGVIYFVGTGNVVRAVEATSGKIFWEFDPKVAEELRGQPITGWSHSRGITLYKCNVFLATWDGRLIALNAKTGREVWSVRTFELGDPRSITGAPKAFKGKVLVGNGGADDGPSRGYVSAYDAETGELAWRFYIVPGNPADGFENDAMAMAAETWTGKWWEYGGGGHAWNAFTYDDDLDVVYIGTGNGSPWNRKIRSPDGGDNLFLSSIVALKPDTGEYLWHYQETPGESWDYNSTQDIVLADLDIARQTRKVILHAPKNGFFYVIDRETGKLISAEPFVDTYWASHVDLKTGKPVETPNAAYQNGETLASPTGMGGHNWQPMSYNPVTGLVYIPSNHSAAIYSDKEVDLAGWVSQPFEDTRGVNVSAPPRQPRDYRGSLQAWDPVTNSLVWRVEQETPMNGGTLTTAGDLVFQGRNDGKFIAYDAETGEILWEFDAGLGISAPPVSYSVGDKQYISVLVGYGGGYTGMGAPWTVNLGWQYGAQVRRLLTFSLFGQESLPEKVAPSYAKPIYHPDFRIDASLAASGEEKWTALCGHCHGMGGISSGFAPDLRASAIPLNREAFTAVVREGAFLPNVMPSFPDISDTDLKSLMHFIRLRAHETHADVTK